ncbi:MAG TPA: glycosyltransferase [Bacillota bacterium]|nr:glycosyltransferase [Limisphaerales bacterium]HOI37333.1 glycosyltransferase [Bacillota bacterium]HOS76297.1 glycosyltransferase [Verrucomicrobiota bacterium]HRD03186.1 glycosyltransferase [Verrucomicrobiota bacterium]
MNIPVAESSLRGKRIGFIFGGTALGGGERQALVLARHLRAACRADAQILPWGVTAFMADIYHQYELPWRAQPFKGWWPATRTNMVSSLVKYAWAIRRLRMDLLVSFMMEANVLAGVVWPWVGAKGCIWNQVDEGRERHPGRWERLAVRQTPCFISNSNHGADFLRDQLGASRDRVHVVYNGIAPEPATKTGQQWRTELGIDTDTFVACMVANLTAFKDHATLLHAWKIVIEKLAEHNQKAVLLLAGRFGTQTQPLKLLAYDLDLGRSVRFLGVVKDITGLAECSDLCVFSSRLEGCPNAVLECMAAGLPVVGTDIPGIREAVGPDNFEFLAPPGDAVLLAAQILLMARDPVLQQTVGHKNRHRVATVFSVEGMCAQATALITSILNTGPAGKSRPQLAG